MIMRLQKLIAASGFCSRRAAEELIRSGRVAVNGETASLGDSADSERDQITIDNKPLRQAAERTYIMLNKPRGYVTTMSDERGRKTVADLILGLDVRVFPVGRLDRDTTGLLIITDDGDFAHRVLAPQKSIYKTYIAELDGDITDNAPELFLRGITLADGTVCRSAYLKRLSDRTAEIKICEGKYHQIKRMFGVVGLGVNSLERRAVGGLLLPDFLKPGECVEMSEADLNLAIFDPNCSYNA